MEMYFCIIDIVYLVCVLGSHDRYVKNLLKKLLGYRFDTSRQYTLVEYAAGYAQIDGVILSPSGNIAVEIESRTAKQVRGAILDLFFHEAKKKLLIIVPEHMYDPYALKKDTEHILNMLKKIKPDIVFKVVTLRGSGSNPKPNDDLTILREAIKELQANP